MVKFVKRVSIREHICIAAQVHVLRMAQATYRPLERTETSLEDGQACVGLS